MNFAMAVFFITFVFQVARNGLTSRRQKIQPGHPSPQKRLNKMIESIRLKNYKAFEDTGLITIAPVTLIMGKNSSGKSSLLKLFPFISGAVGRGHDSECRLYPVNGVRTLRLGARFEDLFHFRKFVNLGIELHYSGNVALTASFLMNNGRFLPSSYSVANKDEMQSIEFTAEDAASAPCALTAPELLEKAGVDESTLSVNVRYIGPLRCFAPYRIEREEASSDTYVGYDGCKTYGILLHSWLTDREVFDAVSAWMAENMEGQALAFDTIDTQGTLFSLMVDRKGIKVNIADVGVGLMQVLPVIVQTYLHNPGTITVVEQPGIHLHPAAHAAIASRMAESSRTTGQRFVIESHSENLVLGLRRAIANPTFPAGSDDVRIYFINSEEKPFSISEITIDPKGMLSSWPTGVFSESASLLEEIEEFQS